MASDNWSTPPETPIVAPYLPFSLCASSPVFKASISQWMATNRRGTSTSLWVRSAVMLWSLQTVPCYLFAPAPRRCVLMVCKYTANPDEGNQRIKLCAWCSPLDSTTTKRSRFGCRSVWFPVYPQMQINTWRCVGFFFCLQTDKADAWFWLFLDQQGSLTTKQTDRGLGSTLEAHSGNICQI